MRHRAETTFDLWGEPLSLGYMFEYKHTDLDGAAAFAGSNRIRYGLHTFDPSYDFTLGEGSLERGFQWSTFITVMPMVNGRIVVCGVLLVSTSVIRLPYSGS